MCVAIFVVAANDTPFAQRKLSRKTTLADSITNADSTRLDTIAAHLADSLEANQPDTTKMDSMQLAIYRHNKASDDSIHLDSLNRQRANGINSPVQYTANDSLVYDATSKTARLYGQSTVKH